LTRAAVEQTNTPAGNQQVELPLLDAPDVASHHDHALAVDQLRALPGAA
jgi:hypothetical protein